MNRLQDEDSRNTIVCNQVLEDIFQQEEMEFHQLSGLLRVRRTGAGALIKPFEDTILDIEITREGSHSSLRDFPVRVESDIRSNMRTHLADFERESTKLVPSKEF